MSQPPTPTAEMMKRLQDYDWPGNVRELQNVVERALIVSGSGPLFIPGFTGAPRPVIINGDAAGEGLNNEVFPSLDDVAREHIRQAMRIVGGRIQGEGGAAALLGIQPNTLRAKMRKMGIPYGRKAMKWDN